MNYILYRFVRPIRFSARFTFELYLIHFPTAMLAVSVLHYYHDGPAKSSVILLAAILVPVSVGMLVEPRRKQFRLAIQNGLATMCMWFTFIAGRREKLLSRVWPDPGV